MSLDNTGTVFWRQLDQCGEPWKLGDAIIGTSEWNLLYGLSATRELANHRTTGVLHREKWLKWKRENVD